MDWKGDDAVRLFLLVLRVYLVSVTDSRMLGVELDPVICLVFGPITFGPPMLANPRQTHLLLLPLVPTSSNVDREEQMKSSIFFLFVCDSQVVEWNQLHENDDENLRLQHLVWYTDTLRASRVGNVLTRAHQLQASCSPALPPDRIWTLTIASTSTGRPKQPKFWCERCGSRPKILL